MTHNAPNRLTKFDAAVGWKLQGSAPNPAVAIFKASVSAHDIPFFPIVANKYDVSVWAILSKKKRHV